MADETLELLKALISRESITPHDNGCQDLVAERLRQVGFHLRWINRGETTNLWATHGEGAPLFCFAGHTDVVPPGPVADWISDPFEANERDGFIIGRGAADMKSGVAAMAIAAEEMALNGHSGTIAILLTSDEEGSGEDGTSFALDSVLAEGVKIDFALVGEPTSEHRLGDLIKIGRRGSMNGKVTVTGKQGHTGYPQLADNAAHKLVSVVSRILDLDWREDDLHPASTTLQISDLLAGTNASNVIPGTASCSFNIRFTTFWSVEEIQARVEQAALGAGNCEFEWQASALPFRTRSADLLDAATEAILRNTELKAELTTGGGTSDARFFAARNIPVIEFGPVNKTIHAANESVEIAALEPLTRIYVEIARAMLANK